jgi:hypothetical protein
MLPNVTETSISDYRDPRTVGDLCPIRERILERMEPSQTDTRCEIAALAGIDHSCAAGRVNELLKAGSIVVVGAGPRDICGREVDLLSLLRAAV